MHVVHAIDIPSANYNSAQYTFFSEMNNNIIGIVLHILHDDMLSLHPLLPEKTLILLDIFTYYGMICFRYKIVFHCINVPSFIRSLLLDMYLA